VIRPSAHVIQASAFAIPLRDESFAVDACTDES
jgi:hypothetical protein